MEVDDELWSHILPTPELSTYLHLIYSLLTHFCSCCSNSYVRIYFFSLTWFEPEPNLPNPVLSVPVRGSFAAWFWFAVRGNSSENRTIPNFSIPICIVTPTEVLTFGGGKRSPELKVELRVQRPAFWTRVVLFRDLGFAEAFMHGDDTLMCVSSTCQKYIHV